MFEFGCDAQGRVLLIDEVLTPDSSRFWPAGEYQPGRPQPSFDKQPLRDFLDIERRAGRWNGEAPAPQLPIELVQATSQRYQDAFRRLTGLGQTATNERWITWEQIMSSLSSWARSQEASSTV